MSKRLNIPNLNDILKHENILIMGIGGGFDVYCGLPLYYELKQYEKNIVLANYSFTLFHEIESHTKSKFLLPQLVENGEVREDMRYNPEGYLYEGLRILDIDTTIYSIERNGSTKTLEAIQYIVQKHNIDCIIAVDGGIDSIFHGNEKGCGTILEDSISLSALSFLPITKYLTCIGLTTELEDKVCNHSAFRLISEYMKSDSLIGTCSLTKNMDSFQFFKTLCQHCWNRPNHKRSHISSKIIPAVEGEFDERYFNFLMGMYFFFEIDTVVKSNQLVPALSSTTSFQDAIAVLNKRVITEERKSLIL